MRNITMRKTRLQMPVLLCEKKIINRDVQAILTRAGAKARTKGASNDLIVNTDKTAIEVSSDSEFEAFITDEEAMKEVMNMSS